MAYFECIIGGGTTIEGNTITVTCDHRFAGLTITCSNGVDVHTQTCPSLSPYTVQFTNLAAGTWTISGTISGKTYSTTVTISDEYTSTLDAGFSWEEWLTLGGLDPTDYNSLAEVLADEKALRRLMTVHASIDYMCDNEDDTETLEIILGNDLAAKWINLRDYALDSLYAVPAIATIMDNAGKYGYGEWALMPQVPRMTSNTAPYGVASASSELNTSNAAWKAFDGSSANADCWQSNGNPIGAWLQYQFPAPIKLAMVKYIGRQNAATNTPKSVTIKGSNDGTNFTDIKTYNITNSYSGYEQSNTIDCDTAYSYIRLVVNSLHNDSTTDNVTIGELQFYAWQPKGCVPVMTSNTAPYGTVSASGSRSGSAPYYAFDGGVNNWQAPDNSGTTSWLKYRFTNPMVLKKIGIHNYVNSGTGLGFKIQGSNDDSTWTDLLSATSSDEKVTHYFEVENYNAYLYLRLVTTQCNVTTSGFVRAVVDELQFYGRSLNVSVPVMTNNTAPYGEVSASTTLSGRDPYYVFSGLTPSTSYFWCSTYGQSNQWLQYKFTRPTCVTMFTFQNGGDAQYSTSTNLTLQGSNDGFVNDSHDLKTVTLAASTTHYVAVDNTDGYLYYRFKINGQNNTYNGGSCRVYIAQFYGIDYSEREFATGSTMKYLYDHGLELETFTYNTNNASCVAQNANEQIEISVPAATQRVASALTEIDLTNYSLFRGKVGEQVITTAIMRVMSSLTPSPTEPTVAIATYNVGDANLPNNCVLGISTFNQSYAVGIVHGNNTGSTASKSTWKELWLE